MGSATDTASICLKACDCRTPFGDAAATVRALLDGRRALAAHPVQGVAGGDAVPLALLPGRMLDETVPPSWLGVIRELVAGVPGEGWGTVRRPVFVSSSNFGVGNLLAFRRTGGKAHLRHGSPFASVEWLRRELGWGVNVSIFSHACVSAHLALLQASRVVEAGLADEALVFSFDLLSPFVAAGFHALKILNDEFPAPYRAQAVGAIGLGDGAAWAVLSRAGKARGGDLLLGAQSVFNELSHFTTNRPDGSGYVACIEPVARAAAGRRVWCKGHGTGTLEAGRLESSVCAASFPGAPLVGWKGGLGHTLGSCGLVELALVAESLRVGRTPGTVGSASPTFTDAVALDSFDNRAYDAVFCASNAFGGAHAALLVSHA